MRASKPLFLKYTDAMLERSTRGSKIVNIHLETESLRGSLQIIENRLKFAKILFSFLSTRQVIVMKVRWIIF